MLGSGGYGEVWLAKNRETSKVCAVKVIDKKKVFESPALTLVGREAKVMKKLGRVPFVLPLIESFSNSKFAFMVLELAEMGCLESLMERVGPMSQARSGFYLIQIAAGLDSLHRKHVIHRDLKPGNVLLTACGDVKLADFGLSKDLGDRNERTRTICGTWAYTAPEVLRADGYNFAVDWYSLGILVHQLHTGNLPFPPRRPQDTDVELFNIILDGRLVFDQTIDSKVRQCIMCLTSMAPSARPSSTRKLVQDPWVHCLPWKDILLKQIDAPSVPMRAFANTTPMAHWSMNTFNYTSALV
ncbi:hypothetical protein CROQUDRAFT_668403 [Cronartium quercuum f. sp. fusiforme G11]|uniref:cAMP-dependent protein kinase n=1 Tax=Cronartium quercuum f. sp. fusiforme G11 TaxID=708437 RepID=A0A9P6NV06_9BASI|nr:hypothetical protein CROQUDRAFT_668403 [Cronartium quercuum f. sp. fusiforme G11]